MEGELCDESWRPFGEETVKRATTPSRKARRAAAPTVSTPAQSTPSPPPATSALLVHAMPMAAPQVFESQAPAPQACESQESIQFPSTQDSGLPLALQSSGPHSSHAQDEAPLFSSRDGVFCRHFSLDGDVGADAMSPREEARHPSCQDSALLVGFHDLLRQHCADLGKYIEGRLAIHHDQLLKKLTQESTPHNGGLFPRDITPTNSSGFGATCSGNRQAQSVQPLPAAPELVRAPSGNLKKNGLNRDSFHAQEQLKKEKTMVAANSFRIPKTSDSSRASLEEASIWLERFREAILRLVTAQSFEVVVCVLIISNVIFLGIEVQSLLEVAEADVPSAFKVVERAYACSFGLELLLKLVAYGVRGFFCSSDWTWNLLDASFVLISFVEMVMEILQDINPKLEYVRILRVGRMLRILRLVRLIKFFRPLRILVYSVVNTMKSLIWTIILLVVLIYLFGVIFTMAASRRLIRSANDPLSQNFGDLGRSMLTLFQAITGGVDWNHCIDSLGSLHPFWGALFICYIAFLDLFFLNVVTGVVCQAAIESAKLDTDVVMQAQLAVKQRYVQQFQDLFAKVNSGRNGGNRITLHDFEERLQDDSLKNYFEAMELTVDEAWNLFKLLDNSEACAIDVEEFVAGCLKLRGTARSIDLHMLMYQSKWAMKKLSGVMANVEEIYYLLMSGSKSPLDTIQLHMRQYRKDTERHSL